VAVVAVLLAVSTTTFPAVGQLSSPVADAESGDHSPGGALWRAFAVPGWGQVYNRQFVNLPFLYGAIGGLAFLASDINGDYRLYRRAYLYKSFQERVDSGQLTENPNETLKPYYDELSARFGAISSSPLRDRRDNLRRNRDLSFVGIGLVYGLSVLDAYISAHLLDFDVDEDLTVFVRPVPYGLSANVKMRF
jgi:hypothetical protein